LEIKKQYNNEEIINLLSLDVYPLSEKLKAKQLLWQPTGFAEVLWKSTRIYAHRYLSYT